MAAGLILVVSGLVFALFRPPPELAPVIVLSALAAAGVLALAAAVRAHRVAKRVTGTRPHDDEEGGSVRLRRGR